MSEFPGGPATASGGRVFPGDSEDEEDEEDDDDEPPAGGNKGTSGGRCGLTENSSCISAGGGGGGGRDGGSGGASPPSNSKSPVIPLVLYFEELDYQLALEGWLPNALALNFSLASFSRLADFLPPPLLKLGKPPDLNQRRWLQALGVYPCASSYRPST